MSRVALELCEQILTEKFGDLVTSVGMVLLRKKSSPLPVISKQTDINPKQAKQALCSLIQQNLVTFSQTKNGFIEYQANLDFILKQLRFPWYIHCAKTLYGDVAELIVEELLQQGQSLLGPAVEKTRDKLNESIRNSDTAHPEISSQLVRDKVTSLVKVGLIKRCNCVVRDKDSKVISNMPTQPQENVFDLPTSSDFEMDIAGSKRTATGTSNSGPQRKKIKLEGGVGPGAGAVKTEDSDEETSKYWYVNVFQFHLLFRDQTIVAAVAKHTDQKASELMRSMLRLSEIKSNPYSLESAPLSFTEINNAVKDKMTKGTLDQYLRCLSENCHDFVTRVGESGGGQFQINFFKAIEAICVSQVETIVLERFGSKALRMFRVLLVKKNMEQKQVEEHAMISPKEAKELLYKMFAEKFVSLTELSKAQDHTPARTFYLFNVNFVQIVQMLLEKCYQTVLNIKLKRQKCISENRRILDKQERVDAIIATLDAEGATEQKEEVEAMVTPSERTLLSKVNQATKTLDKSEILVDQSVFIFETYLSYTLRPPPPPKKNA